MVSVKKKTVAPATVSFSNEETDSPDVDLSGLLEVNTTRRSFLKYLFFGTGVFFVGKILGPSINIFSGEGDYFSKITDFKNFRVIESNEGLQFFDKMGNEILALDKDL